MMTRNNVVQTLADHKDSTPEAWRGVLACFAVLLGAAWFGFGYSTYAKVMLVVSVFYCVMYFGTPWIMMRMRHKALRKIGTTPANNERKAGFDTFTGWTGSTAATVQMITIPAALALAMVGIAIVNVMVRPG